MVRAADSNIEYLSGNTLLLLFVKPLLHLFEQNFVCLPVSHAHKLPKVFHMILDSGLHTRHITTWISPGSCSGAFVEFVKFGEA
jgi:hypothetical protein